MIQLIIFGLIIIFISLFILNLIFKNENNNTKIFWGIILSCIIFYILFKNNKSIDSLENRYIKYILLGIVILIIIKILEYFYIYRLSNPKTVLYFMTIILISIISICIYFFNESL